MDPEAKDSYQENKYELLAEKYDQSKEWAELLCESLTEQGKEIGVAFDFDSNQVTNTFNAHRIMQMAKQQGVANELKEELLKAGFSEGKLLSSKNTLVEAGIKVGLDNNEIHNVLASEQFASDVREDEAIAKEIGIQSVPFFIIDEAYGMEGAQPVEHIKKMLTDIHQGNLN
jgi:protein disulfide-isomerase